MDGSAGKSVRCLQAKTNKQFQIKLRLDEDSDIIADLEDSMAHGVKKREWLRALFDGSGVPLSRVSKALEKYGVDARTAENILKELKQA